MSAIATTEVRREFPSPRGDKMKLTFINIEAAHIFASMAEDMAETARDDDDTFAADQYAVLAQCIWDAGALELAVDGAQATFAAAVKENLDDGGDLEWHPVNCHISGD